MTLDDETAERIAREAFEKYGPTDSLADYVRAGWDARDAEVEELRAVLAKVREWAQEAQAYYEPAGDTALAILDESPTERETPADEWEYGHEYTHMDGSPYRRRVSYEVFREHAPDGHRADGSPYWNYRQLRRRKAGPWEVVPDDQP